MGTPFVQLNNIPLYRETFCSPMYQLMGVAGITPTLVPDLQSECYYSRKGQVEALKLLTIPAQMVNEKQ